MNQEELARLQDQMYQDMIDAPEEQEREIIDMAHQLAQKMYLHPSARTDFEFHGKQYKAAYRSDVKNFKKIITLFIFDVSKPDRFIRTEGEVDNGLSDLENLRALVAAFLRSRIGEYVVGELDDDNEEEGEE